MSLAAAVVLALTLGQLEPPRRFALVVGVNHGDPGESTLRWAEDDARRMLATFQEIGGVRAEDGVAALDVDAGQLASQLGALEARLRRARPADQLVVYFSGHADDEMLHLKGSHFPVSRIVEFIRRAPVGVALLVLDSCQSGAATRLKGLRPRADSTVGIAPDINGRVIISASAPFEAAQESDAYQGSVFTRHLLAALRGAADASRDGRVTLEEAYHYAYERTLESTLSSAGGLQHPSFWFELRGQGELVLTEPVHAHARLVLELELPGECLVYSEDGRNLLDRFVKGKGPVEFAIPPGTYRLRIRGDKGFIEARATVPPNGVKILTETDLQKGTLIASRDKGLEPSLGWIFLGPAVSSGVVLQTRFLTGGELGLRLDGLMEWSPLPLALLSVAYRDQVFSPAGAPAEREWGARLGLGRSWRWGPASLFTALEGGATFLVQYHLPGEAPRRGVIPYLGVRGGLGLLVSDLFNLSLHVEAGATGVSTLSGPRLGGYGALGLMLELPFRA